MTQEQEQKRNDEYNEYVEQVTPVHNLFANMSKAFILGGIICLLGQFITNIAMQEFGLDKDDAGMWCSMVRKLGRRGRARSDYRVCKRRMRFCRGIPERRTGIRYRLPDF